MHNGERSELVRCMIDVGSQASYISEELAVKLGCPLQAPKTTYKVKTCIGVQEKNYRAATSDIIFTPTASAHHCFLVDPEMSLEYEIPGVTSLVQFLRAQGVRLADSFFSHSTNDVIGGFECLLGADIIGAIKPMRSVDLGTGTAFEVQDGLILFGSLEHLFSIESLGIRETDESVSARERRLVEEFSNEVELRDGKYFVRVPFYDSVTKVPGNHDIALATMKKVRNKLAKRDLADSYTAVFEQQLRDGIIEEVDYNKPSTNQRVFIPHHPVVKTDAQTTTKIRPVFNCSLKIGDRPSLNEACFRGVDLLNDLVTLLMKFRTNKHILLADIEKAFLQIYLKYEEDKDKFCFLWETDDGLKMYRFRTILFGLNLPNVADMLTRGLSAKEFHKKLAVWCHGPDWLGDHPEQWPKSPLHCLSEEGKVMVELQQHHQQVEINTEAQTPATQIILSIKDFSSLRRLHGVTARVFHFVNVLKHREADAKEQATHYWLKVMQENAFTEEISYLQDKQENKRVWMMADPPHLIKRLRNNLLDRGVRTKNGAVLDRELMREMIAIDGNAEYRLLHKLHLQTHVEANKLKVSGLARQKVRPAMQLLSASSALALSRYMDKEEEARLLRIVDDGFDVLNSGHPGDTKPLRRGYSAGPEQEAALSALAEEAATLRIGAARHLYPFQKGILVTVQSVRGLLADIRERCGADTYILTRHLSQDRLESFFGMVRGCGGSNLNPTPTEAKSRLRLLTILILTQHGVSPLRKDARAPIAPAGADAALTDEALAVQVSELYEECDDEDRDQLPEEIEVLVPEPAVEVDIIEDDEDIAEMEALLEEASCCRAHPSSTSGAVDKETGVTASDSAMAHVAGYVARKQGPSLGAPSAFAEDLPVQALWTRLRSVGGLTIPTQEFPIKFRQMDAEFCTQHAMHPDGLSRQPGVIRDTIKMLRDKHPDLSGDVVRTFGRVRTFIRLRNVNGERRMESLAKREKRKKTGFTK
ncbi:Transposable element P transposase [Amphibalanus amphitrite]|uniref:Transposable element P transposase n=1 Tax=Amphibalanus amphitrite TaxID=1232801 RepID=A0A6A4W7C8_AMPAM|nr:Transposable element P transposase [Amphibalanus amphitrite]